jgi:hypothetical protein
LRFEEVTMSTTTTTWPAGPVRATRETGVRALAAQQYEWDTHYRLATRAGLDPDIAKAVAEGRRPERMAEDEGYFTLLAMVMNTARTPLPAGRTPALAPLGR